MSSTLCHTSSNGGTMATKTHSEQPEFENKVIQHVGLISGICDESGLVELIDERVHQPRRVVSVGQAVKAMILNALGFSGRALYLTPRFYKNRPVDLLVGDGLTAEHLNDTSLGTALDALYETGDTELFFSVSQQILKPCGIKTRFAHLDSTTFSLHGEYNNEWNPEKIPEGVSIVTSDSICSQLSFFLISVSIVADTKIKAGRSDMVKTTQTKEQARILKVLSVETRLEILSLLKRGPMCVNALACKLNISQGAVSQHLRVMRDAELLIDDKQGYYVHYRIDPETFAYWKTVIDGVFKPEEEDESKDSRDCPGC